MDMTALAYTIKNQTPFPPSFSSSPDQRAAPQNGVYVLSGTTWLDRVVALHEQVRSEMPEDQKHFLLQKSVSYFRELLTGATGLLFGAFANGELVGTTSLVWADSFEAACGAGKLTVPDPHKRLKKKYGKGRLGIMQSMGICSTGTGRGFSKALIQIVIEAAQKHGCAHLFTQIAEQNSLCWLRFLDHDYAIVTSWEKGHRRFLLRWLSPLEKAKRLRRVKPSGRQSFSKKYDQVAILLTQMVAQIERGNEVFLDNKPNDHAALNLVFCPARSRLAQALSAFKKDRH